MYPWVPTPHHTITQAVCQSRCTKRTMSPWPQAPWSFLPWESRSPHLPTWASAPVPRPLLAGQYPVTANPRLWTEISNPIVKVRWEMVCMHVRLWRGSHSECVLLWSGCELKFIVALNVLHVAWYSLTRQLTMLCLTLGCYCHPCWLMCLKPSEQNCLISSHSQCSLCLDHTNYWCVYADYIRTLIIHNDVINVINSFSLSLSPWTVWCIKYHHFPVSVLDQLISPLDELV